MDAMDASQARTFERFLELTGASQEDALEYLAGSEWNLEAAAASFFQDLEDGQVQPASTQSQAPAAEPEYTGPRTLDGRPAPQEASRAAAANKPQPKKKGIATLGSLSSGGGHGHGHGHGHDHDDDDDEDDEDYDDEQQGGRDLFAGGEKSGLAVQDPKQQGSGSKKIINDIIAKARANASRPDATASSSRTPSSFRGSGQTLGGEGVASRTIPDPLAPAHTPGGVPGGVPSRPTSNDEPQERVLHLWRDGFSIDDGPLRRFDDPENAADLNMIRQGRAPLHLMNVRYDQPVDVKLQQHDENFRQLPRIYRPFGGEGRRLGSPVPGEAAVAAPPPQVAPTSAPSAPGQASTAVDSSLPTITLRIQMPDGQRLTARFNTTQTLDDVYGFVQRASTAMGTRPWVLATTFPNKEHTERELELGDIAELKKGGTVVVKWA